MRIIGHSTSDVPPARLSLDPIFATQRPLYFYAAIALINCGAHAVLRYLGFKHLPQYDTASKSQFIYYRPKQQEAAASTTSSAAASNAESDNSPTALPLVFVHGIGIGFAHYLGMIISFPRNVDVFLVEWPHVGE